MARRLSRTPLYELIKTRGQDGPPSEAQDEAPDPDDALEATGVMSPGRTVRVPVGYLFVAVAVVGALMVGAYLLGYNRGEDALRAEYDDALFAQDGERPHDPLARSEERGGGLAAGFDGGSRSVAEAPGGANASSEWGPIVSDPRQAGFCYFRLIETTDEGARRIASFCRGQGLEAYVVSANNPARRRVIVLPGFDWSDRSAPEVKALEERILRVGSQWRHVEGGATDFGDAFPSLYNG